MAKHERQSYTVSEKLKIIHFAEEHGNRAAQREFCVNERQESSMARTGERFARVGDGETEQRSCHSSYTGKDQSP